MTQTLAAGKSAPLSMAQRYTPVGSVGPAPKKLNRCFMHIIGPYGHGKSRLIQSCPGGFIINADCNPTTIEEPQAELWPFPNADGMMVDATGEPVLLNWLTIRKQVNALIEMARAKVEGRPETVFFDSLPSIVTMARRWASWRIIVDPELRRPKSQQDPAIANMAIEDVTVMDMQSLYGPSTYGNAYAEVALAMDELTKAGYGVGGISHTTYGTARTKDEKGQAQEERIPALTITESFRDYFQRNLDFAFMVKHTSGESTEWVQEPDRTIKKGDGAEVVIKGKRVQRSTTVDQCTVITSDPEWGSYLLRRAGLPPQINLTGPNPWAQLQEIYDNGK